MVRDDAVQILRDAVAKHQAVFREYWDSGLWAKADEHWKHLLILRATGSRADASAKLAERKKQKATRGRIAAQKRTGRGSGGG